jgi:hypothetical protein
VIVNQHAAAQVVSATLTLEHAGGELALTPDHLLKIDGAFQPAANVKIGAVLDGGDGGAVTVSKIVAGAHRVVNPLTTSGTILAAGSEGAPVLAATFPVWVGDLLLGSTLYPLPHSLTAVASRFFPHSVQAFYDARLEAFFTASTASLKVIRAALPAPLALAVVAGFDVTLVGAFAVWSLSGMRGAVALAAVAATVAARRRRVAKA